MQKLLGGVSVAVIVLAIDTAGAQPFVAGDTVEASPLSLANSWQSCTVSAVLASGDYEVKCGPRQTEYVVQSRWVRPAAAPQGQTPGAAQPQEQPAAPPAPPPPTQQSAAPAPPPTAAPAMTAAATDPSGCAVGAQVTDRENRSGVITGIANGMCVVALTDGQTRSYLAWMLTQGGAAAAAASTGEIAAGRYECWASGAGGAASYYTLVDIQIRSATQYADKAGTAGAYSYDAASKRLTFQTGPLVGQRAEYLEAGKIGLSSKPAGFFDMVCNLKA
jgi:hypothetical protein